MARCRATTTKGTRCRNPAMEGSEFCGVHKDRKTAGRGSGGGQEEAGGSARRGARPSTEDSLATLLGLALVGGIVYLVLKLGRRW